MISVIIPFHNEEKNLPILINSLTNVLKNIKENWEVILVDDGSSDNYDSKLKMQKAKLKIVKHKKKLGKGEAIKTGIENSQGEILIFMDADLQDDPVDLPKFLEKLNEGYDIVNGVRKIRKDNFFVKFYSFLASKFLKIFLHSPYTDINCGFKAFRREVLKNFVFYGNNFRFFPLFVFYNGFKVTEVEVKNNPRRFGKSKFGSGKLMIGIFDTLTAYFLYKFSEKPLHFFGIIGSCLFIIGFLISLYLAVERIFFNVLLYRRPVLLLGILLIIVGIQIVMTGIIGELVVYLSKKKDS